MYNKKTSFKEKIFKNARQAKKVKSQSNKFQLQKGWINIDKINIGESNNRPTKLSTFPAFKKKCWHEPNSNFRKKFLLIKKKLNLLAIRESSVRNPLW